MKIVYDPILKRPFCPILQAVGGGDPGIASRFPVESWLVKPTENIGLFLVTEQQLSDLIATAQEALKAQ